MLILKICKRWGKSQVLEGIIFIGINSYLVSRLDVHAYHCHKTRNTSSSCLHRHFVLYHHGYAFNQRSEEIKNIVKGDGKEKLICSDTRSPFLGFLYISLWESSHFCFQGKYTLAGCTSNLVLSTEVAILNAWWPIKHCTIIVHLRHHSTLKTAYHC